MIIQIILFIYSGITIKFIFELYNIYNLQRITTQLENEQNSINQEILRIVNEQPFIQNLYEYKDTIISASGINKFLELVLKASPENLSNNLFEKQQAELIKFSINNGATYLFDNRKSFYAAPLKTLEYLKILVNDGSFPSNFFLKQVVISYKYDTNYRLTDNEKESLFYSLVEFSISRKADVNTIVIDNFPILQFVNNQKVFKLLEKNGAKCSFYTQNLKKIIDSMNLTEAEIKIFPKKLYHSLIQTKKTYIEIPKLLHHIWLTGQLKPQEISTDDLTNILKTKNFFNDKMDGNWRQIVWVNNKDLIPVSMLFLENHNIEVKSIDDFRNHLILFDEITKLIYQDKLVMASDLLRYNLIEILGGVYSDLNYKFLNEFNLELKKYDFFINSLVNSFFMARPNHPIIKAEVIFLKKFFNEELVDLLWLKDHLNIKEQTMLTTAHSFAYNIIKHINEADNVDFVYPSNSKLVFDGFNCGIALEAYKYADLMEYCSNPLTITGMDYHSNWIS